MRFRSTSSLWDKLQPNNNERKDLGQQPDHTSQWGSTVPSKVQCTVALFIQSNLWSHGGAFQVYPKLVASHAPTSEALQINMGKWGSRASAECWSWMSLCFLQMTVKVMMTENQPGLDREWWRGTKVITTKIPLVLQRLLCGYPPPWSWMKRFCRKPPMIPKTFFLPLLLGHPGQWCWEYYRRKEQCPGPSHKHLFILHLKEMRSISLHLHFLP